MSTDKLHNQLKEIAREGMPEGIDLWPAIHQSLNSPTENLPIEAATQHSARGVSKPVPHAPRLKLSLTPVIALGLITLLGGIPLLIALQNNGALRFGAVDQPDATATRADADSTQSEMPEVVLDAPIPQPVRPVLPDSLAMPYDIDVNFVPLIPTFLPEGMNYQNAVIDGDAVTFMFNDGTQFITLTQIIGVAADSYPVGQLVPIENMGVEAVWSESGNANVLSFDMPTGIRVEMMTDLTLEQAIQVAGGLDFPKVRYAFNESLPDGSQLAFSLGFVPLMPSTLPEGFVYDTSLTTEVSIVSFRSADGEDTLRIAQYGQIGFTNMNDVDPQSLISIYESPALVRQANNGDTEIVWRTMDGTRIELTTTLPVDDAFEVVRGLVYATPYEISDATFALGTSTPQLMPTGYIMISAIVKEAQVVNGKLTIYLAQPINEAGFGVTYDYVVVEPDAEFILRNGDLRGDWSDILPGMQVRLSVKRSDLVNQEPVLTANLVIIPSD